MLDMISFIAAFLLLDVLSAFGVAVSVPHIPTRRTISHLSNLLNPFNRSLCMLLVDPLSTIKVNHLLSLIMHW